MQSAAPERDEDLAAGLSDSDREADALARWPHLGRPGPQPENLAAGRASLLALHLGSEEAVAQERARIRHRRAAELLRACRPPAGDPGDQPAIGAGLAAALWSELQRVQAELDRLRAELPGIVQAEVNRLLADQLPEAIHYLLANGEARANGRAPR